MPKTKYKKRSDGRYLKQIKIGYQDNGKPKLKSFYANTVQELEAKVAAFQSQYAKGILIDDQKLTLGQWAQQWVSTYKKDAQYNTYATYEGCIRRHLLSLPISDMVISKVTPMHLQQAVNTLVQNGLTRTVELFVLTLHQIFSAAVENSILYKDPSKKIKAPKFHKQEKRVLTEEEKAAIRSADYTPKERAFLMLGWQAGLRRGEILALRKEHIDFEKNIIHVKDNVIFKENTSEINHYTKTDAGVRDVPMPATLRAFLKTYTQSCNDHLFTTQTGEIATKSMFRRMFTSILNKTADYMPDGRKPNFTAHILRHTYATTLYYTGIDVKTAQYLLGHKNVTVTLEIYTHLKRRDTDVAEKLSAAFL